MSPSITASCIECSEAPYSRNHLSHCPLPHAHTQEKAEALVDFVDFYLNSGKLKRTSNAGTRSELIEQVESASCVSEPICDRDKLLIYGAALAPEFQIQQ